MRAGWEYKKLGEVCEFINDGDWIESKDQSESGIRLIQTGNIGNGIFKDKEERAKYISHETFSRLGCTEIFEGDCLVSRLPEPIGRCCVLPPLDSRCITAVDCSILRFKAFVIPKFFVYYSQSSKYAIDIENKTTGTTRKRISRKNLESIQIPLPTIPQQRLIVSELDEINSLIALKRGQLKKYDELAQSLFYEMFGDPVENEKGWVVKKLGEISEIVRGGSPRPIDKYLGGTYPWIKIGDATKGDDIYLKQTKEFIVEEGLKKTRYIPEGSLIFANCGVSLGFARIITLKGCIHDGWLAFMNIDETIIDKLFLLKSINYCTEYFRGLAPEGTQPNLNTTIMKCFVQILPPLSLQQTFAHRIEQIEEQKKQITAAIAKLETLLASRMQYWFE